MQNYCIFGEKSRYSPIIIRRISALIPEYFFLNASSIFLSLFPATEVWTILRAWIESKRFFHSVHGVCLGLFGDVDVGLHGFVVGMAGEFHDDLGAMPLERATQIQYSKTIINKVPNKIK